MESINLSLDCYCSECDEPVSVTLEETIVIVTPCSCRTEVEETPVVPDTSRSQEAEYLRGYSEGYHSALE